MSDIKLIYIYTRRKDGAKAPSLLDHLELRFPTFDAKAMDLRRRSQMLKPCNFRNPIPDAKAQNLGCPIGDAKPRSLRFDLRK